MTRTARAERTYRRLLGILPRRLRRDAEPDLLDVFRDAYARTAPAGRLALLGFWIRMTANLVAAALAERLSSPVSIQGVFAMPSPSRLVDEVRVAARRLVKRPAWTFGAAGTLALGLAASVVTIVLVRDILLRPLAFPHADRLVRLREIDEKGGCCWYPSFPNAADWRKEAQFFSGVGIADIPRVTPVLLDGTAVRVPVSRAARGFFETLGVRPIAGRFFTDDENRPGGAAVAVVSERFWRGALGSAEPGTATLTIGTSAYAVVGVLPRGFRFLGDGAVWTSPADVWTPMDRDTDLGSRTSHGYHVVARLRDGVTLARARVEMNQLAQTLLAQHKEPTQAHSIQMVPLQDLVVGKARGPLRLLLYGAAGVLLIACLNLAAAVLAMGIGRARELSVRLALGATRWTLARLLLVEAQTLALPGTLLGLVLAALAFQVIRATGGGALPRLDEVHLDAASFAIALALALVTATLAGLIPAAALSRSGVIDRLRTHGATTGPREHQRVWTAFVVVQAALTVLLLAGTGLLVRSFVRALDVDLGYDAHQVLAVDVGLPPSSYEAPARKVAYYDAALAALRATPGIAAAGLTSVLPYETTAYTSGTHRDVPGAKSQFAGYRLVDPEYFDTLGIPRLRGDEPAFRAGGALVDRTLQRALWGEANPIGDRVQISFSDRVLTVSGIVGAIREWDQGGDEIGVVYVDYHQRPAALDTMHVVVRYTGPLSAAVNGVRAAMASADPLVPVTIEPLDSRATRSLGDRRLFVLLAGGFGVIALLLSAAGVHAMVAFAVARHRREAAIRLALGAQPRELRRRVVARGCVPAMAGVAAGLALSVPLGRLMQAQLFQVAPSDPVAIGAAACAVGTAAILATVLPAHRASRVDPATALRQD